MYDRHQRDHPDTQDDAIDELHRMSGSPGNADGHQSKIEKVNWHSCQ
jgi:hypothetical protein